MMDVVFKTTSDVIITHEFHINNKKMINFEKNLRINLETVAFREKIM
jgi:hypothetical protein